MGTVPIETLVGALAHGERPALLPFVEAGGTFVGLDGFREPQFGARSIGVDLADEGGVHVLVVEHGAEPVGLRGDPRAVVAVGLHGMDPFAVKNADRLGTHSGDGQ